MSHLKKILWKVKNSVKCTWDFLNYLEVGTACQCVSRSSDCNSKSLKSLSLSLSWFMTFAVSEILVQLDCYISGNTMKLHKYWVACVYGRRQLYLADFQDGLWTQPSKGIWRLPCWVGKFMQQLCFVKSCMLLYSCQLYLLTIHGLYRNVNPKRPLTR
jgi:hypothetical protein